jgi:plasmid stability protein
MATLTIKNLPNSLHKHLKQSGARHRRSANSEVITYLEKALTGDRVAPQVILRRARALRDATPRLFVTEEDLREAKNEGRL